MADEVPEWKNLEQVIARAFRRNPNARVYEDWHGEGKSGRQRQMDLLVVYPFEITLPTGSRLTIPIRIAVDCKHKTQGTIGIKTVDGFYGHMVDLGAQCGVIVSTARFGEGAKARADKENISLMETRADVRTLAEALDRDGNWELVDAIEVAQETAKSPFVFERLLADAKEHVFIAGQNLSFLLNEQARDSSWELISSWLRESDRRMDILIMDEEDNPAVAVWGEMLDCKSEFKEALSQSTITLLKWRKEETAWADRLDMRVSRFVPVTITFIDSDSPDGSGRLVLTPVVHRERDDRPTFVVGSGCPKSKVFGYYQEKYEDLFKRARRIA